MLNGLVLGLGLGTTTTGGPSQLLLQIGATDSDVFK